MLRSEKREQLAVGTLFHELVLDSPELILCLTCSVNVQVFTKVEGAWQLERLAST